MVPNRATHHNCDNYSSFEKFLRVTSYILSFKANILSKLRKVARVEENLGHIESLVPEMYDYQA